MTINSELNKYVYLDNAFGPNTKGSIVVVLASSENEAVEMISTELDKYDCVFDTDIDLEVTYSVDTPGVIYYEEL